MRARTPARQVSEIEGSGLRQAIGAAIAAGAAFAVATTPASAGRLPIPPFLTIASAAATEGDAGSRVVRLRVRLSRAAGQDVTVAYETADGTARAGADYDAARGTVRIPAGRTLAIVGVRVRSDTVPEYTAGGVPAPEETFSVRLSSPSGAALRTRTGTVTIREDDFAFDLFRASANGHDAANAYLLSLVSHFAYDENLGASTIDAFETAFATKFQPYGIERDTVDAIEGLGGTLTQTQAIAFETATALVIGFRGTEFGEAIGPGIVDVINDLAFGQTLLGVHAGFDLAATSVLPDVRARVRAALDANKRVWLTGHSLGGALATVTALKLQSEALNVQGVYTYGAPRTFSPATAAAYNALFAGRPTQRWVNALDPIPHYPALAMSVTGPFYLHVAQVNNIRAALGGGCSVVLNDGESLLGGNFLDHDTKRYSARLWWTLSATLRPQLPRPPWPYSTQAAAPTTCDAPPS